MNNSTLYRSGQILADGLIGLFYFPIWWYSTGLLKTINWLKDLIITQSKNLALGVWLKNIFTPMYGQQDLAGVLISFFVRLAQIIFRSIMLLLWLIVAFFILTLWLIAPIMIVLNIINQLAYHA